jgi:hypothetical protein
LEPARGNPTKRQATKQPLSCQCLFAGGRRSVESRFILEATRPARSIHFDLPRLFLLLSFCSLAEPPGQCGTSIRHSPSLHSFRRTSVVPVYLSVELPACVAAALVARSKKQRPESGREGYCTAYGVRCTVQGGRWDPSCELPLRKSSPPHPLPATSPERDHARRTTGLQAYRTTEPLVTASAANLILPLQQPPRANSTSYCLWFSYHRGRPRIDYPTAAQPTSSTDPQHRGIAAPRHHSILPFPQHS